MDQSNQSITRAISLIGRVAAYRVYQGTGFDSPLTPAPRGLRAISVLFEGGASFSPFQSTFFTLLSGENAGDADAPVFENECSSWIWLQSVHPVNLAYSTSDYFENGVTSGLVDARIVTLSTARVLLLAGVGGADLGWRLSTTSGNARAAVMSASSVENGSQHRPAGWLRQLTHVWHGELLANIPLGRIKLLLVWCPASTLTWGAASVVISRTWAAEKSRSFPAITSTPGMTTKAGEFLSHRPSRSMPQCARMTSRSFGSFTTNKPMRRNQSCSD